LVDALLCAAVSLLGLAAFGVTLEALLESAHVSVQRCHRIQACADRQPASASSGSPAFIARELTRKMTTPSIGAEVRSRTSPKASWTSPTTVPAGTRSPTATDGCQQPLVGARTHA